MDDRFDRNIRLWGKEGQERIRESRVAVVGIGGLGTHVVQQLSYLGVGELRLIDSEELDRTNLNRYVGARHDDPVPGTRKVDIGERTTHSVDPTIRVHKAFNSLVSTEAFDLIKSSNYVFGCLDREGPRFILNELCTAYSLPYFDLASDIPPEEIPTYGGRVCIAWDGNGCLTCLDVLDMKDVQNDLSGPAAQRERDAIYGVDRSLLDRTGPSVVSLNGVISSLGVTEFAVSVSGIRPPYKLLTYRGQTGKTTVGNDPPHPGCYWCKGMRGRREKADVERYIREGVGEWLR